MQSAALLVSLIFAQIAPGILLFVLLHWQLLSACAKVEKRPPRQSHHSSHHSTPSRTDQAGPLSTQHVSSPALKDSPQSFTANSASFEKSKQGSSQQNKDLTNNDSSFVPEPGRPRDLAQDKKQARFAFLHHLLKKTGDKQRKKQRLRGQIKKKPKPKSEKELEPTQTGLDTTQVATDPKAQGGKTDATIPEVSAWSQNTCTAQGVNSKVNTALFINE